MEQIYTQIRQYIDENRQPMLNLWRDLVNTESGTTQIDGVNAVCSILRREMENAGIHTRVRAIQNSGDMLIGEWNPGSSKAPLLLIGHMDTVFKEGAAKDNPFRVDENGMAHGPGVLDMKAGLVMALYTVKALDSVDWKERPIKFIFASDEENLHMRSDAKEIFAEEAAGALAAFNFETGYMDNRFVVGRKGGGPVSIKIHGRASHSGIAPEKGRSAVLEAAHKIVEIESQNDIMRGRLMNCGMVDGGMVDGGVEALPQSYSGGAFADPLGMVAVPMPGGGGVVDGGSMGGSSGGASDDSTGIIVWVKSKEAPANAILEPDPTWDCPEGFWAVPVEVGLSDNSKVEITRGLAEGQEVFIGYQNPDEMYY